jgi:hypothetical protein
MEESKEQELFDSIDNMSDDEIMNTPFSDDIKDDPYEESSNEKSDEEESSEASVEEDPDIDDEEKDLEDDHDEGENQSTDTSDDDDDDGDKDEDTTDTSSPEGSLAELFAPFNANGREMKVDSIDEARHLMQMGANYNKKMTQLKPNLKMLKMLENNELLDPGKINYLIDLAKKDPVAIARLIKESGVDTYALPEDTDYEPNTYNVDDNEMVLEEVLDEIRDSSAYSQTLNIISTKWDAESKSVLLNNPTSIKQINEHVELGIYAQIEARMEKDKMLGGLTGMTDLEAYKVTGDALANEGAFAQYAKKGKPIVPKSAAKNKIDQQTRKRKLAASSTKSNPSSKGPISKLNPLEMSDEEAEIEFKKVMGI